MAARVAKGNPGATFALELTMGVFLVTNYSLSAQAVRTPPAVVEILHAILLAGIPESGPLKSANILFATARGDIYPGVVSNGGLVGFILDAMFASWYDILRNERPVRLRYHPDPTSPANTPLERLELFTGPEPLGEGPVDLS
jgi:hypothetical protein